MAERFGLVRYTVDGAVDTGWGDGGVLPVEFTGGGGKGANGLSIADPMYYVRGTVAVDGNPRVAVARVHSSGLLLQRYGDEGRVVTEFPSQDGRCTAATVIDSTGSLVVAGRTAVASNPSVALAKYDDNGRVDASFGEDGVLLTDFAAGAAFTYDVAVDAADRLVVGGFADIGGSHQFALLRYRPDGQRDADFGAGGVVVTDGVTPFEAVRSVSATPEGWVVVAGTASTPDGDRFAVRRYDGAGRFDIEFGDRGTLTPPFLSSASPTYAAIDFRGRVVLAGTGFGGDEPRAVVARYRPNGTPDESFAGGGWTTARRTESDPVVTALAVDDCGRPVVADIARSDRRGRARVRLRRYNTDGSPDRTFDGDGRVSTNVRGDEGGRAVDVAIDSRDRVVVAGTVQTDRLAR